MELRRATIADIPVIVMLAGQVWRSVYPSIIPQAQIEYMLARIYDPETMAEELISGRTYLLAHENGLQGYCSFSAPHIDKIARIHQLYVLPSSHKRGVGRALLEEVEQSAVAAGCDAIELNVNRANPALGFYQRRGFSVKESMDIPFGPFILNDYVMRRDVGSGHENA